MQKPQLTKKDNCWVGQFTAMASPCEVIVETTDKTLAQQLLSIVSTEAWRIEQKFSRYRDDNIVYQINNNPEQAVEVDTETAQLLNFAEQLYQLSNGLFDITSGVLRRAWTFDGSDLVPDHKDIQNILTHVGWQKLSWQPPHLTLMHHMQIDFGGIGKEYAVDRCIQKVQQVSDAACLINFGGDLAVTRARQQQTPWLVGIESTEDTRKVAQEAIQLKKGAIATSGDVRRYLLKEGVRYGHILNPKTGWPVEQAPRSVTVAAATCTEAGMLATLAMLQGAACERFLDEEDIQYWCIR